VSVVVLFCWECVGRTGSVSGASGTLQPSDTAATGGVGSKSTATQYPLQ